MIELVAAGTGADKSIAGVVLIHGGSARTVPGAGVGLRRVIDGAQVADGSLVETGDGAAVGVMPGLGDLWPRCQADGHV